MLGLILRQINSTSMKTKLLPRGCSFSANSTRMTLSALVLFLSASAVQSQSFPENFANNDLTAGLNPDWSWKDLDGDGHFWRRMIINDQKFVAGSIAINKSPDNILSTTKAITISSSNNILKWTVGSGVNTNGTTSKIYVNNTRGVGQVGGLGGYYVNAGTQGGHLETYSVYVTTVASVDVSAQSIFNETLPAGGGEFSRNLDLSAYNGQSIYIHFRHHNSNNQGVLYLDDIDLKNGSTTGLQSQSSKEKLSVFPNPSNGLINVNVELKSATDDVDLKVYTMTGNLIKEASLNNNAQSQLDLSSLELGVYLLEVSSRNTITKSQRIIISE